MLILVKVYGDSSMKKAAVYKWVKIFSDGRESITDEERSGRPATSRTEENIAKVREVCVKIFDWLSEAEQSKWTSTEKQLGKS